MAGLGNPSQRLVTCVPLGSQAGGWQPPSLSSWPPARVPQWKTLRRGCWGAAGGPRGWIYPSALCHCSGCCSKHPSPHQRVGALTGSCLPGGTADGKCNQKGLFSWLYAGCRSAEARLGSRWRGQGQGLWVCKVTAGRGAEGHSGCQHCPVTSLGVRGGCNAPHPALPTLPSTATEQGQLFLAENCALSSGEGAAPQPPTLLLVAFQQNAARVTLVFLSAPGRERISFLPLNVGSWCEHWGFLSPQLRAPLFSLLYGFLDSPPSTILAPNPAAFGSWQLLCSRSSSPCEGLKRHQTQTQISSE